jgi:hypothetical protein
MKTIETVASFLDNILGGKKGYRLQNPLVHESVAIVPITRDTTQKRKYMLSSELPKDVRIYDSGRISRTLATIAQNITLPVLFLSGTSLYGTVSQHRAITHDQLLMPKTGEQELDVKCINAPAGIRRYSSFMQAGISPRGVQTRLRSGSQADTWRTIRTRTHKRQSYASNHCNYVASSSLHCDIGYDDLLSSKQRTKDFYSKIEELKKKIPTLENECGFILISAQHGIEGIELFDHCDSLKKRYEDVIEAFEDIFESKTAKKLGSAKKLVTKSQQFLEKIKHAAETPLPNNPHTCTITIPGFEGEVTRLNGSIIHVFLMRITEE